jgi:antitoxin MazE
MQILRWNNSLAVKLPSPIVDALEIREGDEIHVQITGPGTFIFQREEKHQERLSLGYKSPADDTMALIPS